MNTTKKYIEATGKKLYKTYGKPLEKEHWGEFLAVSPKTGKTLIASSLYEAMKKATKAFGRGNFIYKIGPRAVGRI